MRYRKFPKTESNQLPSQVVRDGLAILSLYQVISFYRQYVPLCPGQVLCFHGFIVRLSLLDNLHACDHNVIRRNRGRRQIFDLKEVPCFILVAFQIIPSKFQGSVHITAAPQACNLTYPGKNLTEGQSFICRSGLHHKAVKREARCRKAHTTDTAGITHNRAQCRRINQLTF